MLRPGRGCQRTRGRWLHQNAEEPTWFAASSVLSLPLDCNGLEQGDTPILDSHRTPALLGACHNRNLNASMTTGQLALRISPGKRTLLVSRLLDGAWRIGSEGQKHV